MDRPATADGLPNPDDLVGAGVGRARGVLSIRPFRQLYTALVLSSFGDWLGFLATTALAAQLVEGFTAKAEGWELPSSFEEFAFLSYECKPLPTRFSSGWPAMKSS